MKTKYKLFEYSVDKQFTSKNLVEILKYRFKRDISNSDITRLSEKDTSIRLADIFQTKLNDSNLVFLNELEYIDRDFLEGYTDFYARSFTSPPKVCSRIHIFSKISKKLVKKALDSKNHCEATKKLQSSYYGFIVVRPLLHTIYGRSCLSSTFISNSAITKDFFVPGKEFKINLFGIELDVKGVPFIEQDHATSACGTMSIWSSLHSINKLFENHCPSPSKITSTAVSDLPAENMNKFSPELTASQLKKAINSTGLNYIEFKLDGITKRLKSIVRAYCSFGIAPILLVKVKIRGTKSEDDNTKTHVEKDLEYHAITIHGYRNYKYISKQPLNANELFLESHKIKSIFTHDDQGGPFVELNLKKNDRLIRLHSRNILSSLENTATFFEIDSVIVPLYHKIRLSYSSVIAFVNCFQKDFKNILLNSEPSCWDIILMSATELKSKIRDSSIQSKTKKSILFSNLPKYLWVVKCKNDHKDLFTIILDATNYGVGHSILYLYNEDESLLTYYYILCSDWNEYLEIDYSERKGYSPDYIMALQSLSNPEIYWKDISPIKYGLLNFSWLINDKLLNTDKVEFSVCVCTNNEILKRELMFTYIDSKHIDSILSTIGDISFRWVVLIGENIDAEYFPSIILSYDMKIIIENQKPEVHFVDKKFQNICDLLTK